MSFALQRFFTTPARNHSGGYVLHPTGQINRIGAKPKRIIPVVGRSLSRYFVLLIFIASGRFGTATDTIPAIRLSQDVDSFFIADQVLYFIDSTGKMDAHEVIQREFKPLANGDIKTVQQYAYWLQFAVANITADTINYHLCERKTSIIHLYEPDKMESSPLKGGETANYKDLPSKVDRFCFPIRIHPKSTGQFLVRHQDFLKWNKPISQLSIQSEEFVKNRRVSEFINGRDVYVFRIIFLSILLFLLLFFGIQYLFNGEKYVLTYCLYVFFTLTYYSRLFEMMDWGHLIFTHFMEWNYHIEITNFYLIYFSYLLFIYFILDLPNEFSRLGHIVNFSLKMLAVVIVADVIGRWILGISLSFELNKWLRAGLFMYTLYLIIEVLINYKNVLGKYIAIGSVCVSLPAMFTLFTHIVPGVEQEFAYSLLRNYETGFGTFLMYTMRVGILLELTCFTAALGYKSKLVREEVRRMAAKIHEMEKMILERQSDDTSGAEPFMEKVNTIIINNITNENLLSILMNSLNRRRTTLYNEIKKHSGLSPSNYINSVKLSRAKNLLRNPEINISQAAYQVGFNDPVYFSRLFKKVFGETPSEWREGLRI